MAEVVFGGQGKIVDPNIAGAEVNLTPGNVIFTNSTNPRESFQDGVGTPVAQGNTSDPLVSNHFETDGKDVFIVPAPRAPVSNGS